MAEETQSLQRTDVEFNIQKVNEDNDEPLTHKALEDFKFDYNYKFCIFLIFNSSLCIFCIGYSSGVMNTLHDHFSEIFKWNENETNHYMSIFSSIHIIVALLGCLSAHYIMDSIGRRNTFFLCNLGVSLGSIITMIYNTTTIIMGRILLGYFIGIFEILVPIYVNEYAPYEISGSCGGIYQCMYLFGILISHFLGFGLPQKHAERPWYGQFMLIFPLIMCSLNTIFLLTVFREDTPKYLFTKGQLVECDEILKKIYKREIDIKKMNEDYSKLVNFQGRIISYKEIFLTKRYLSRILIAMSVNLSLKLSGIDAIIVYSRTIFKDAQKLINPTYFTVFVSLTQFIFGFFSIFAIDYFGRRTLILLGLGGSSFILVLISASYFYGLQTSSIYLFFPFAAINGGCLFPMAVIYPADILPDKALPICMFFHVLAEYLVVETFLHLKAAIEVGGTFLIYASLTYIIFIIDYFFVIETKNLSHYEISKKFKQKFS
jgi:MFS family permease